MNPRPAPSRLRPALARIASVVRIAFVVRTLALLAVVGLANPGCAQRPKIALLPRLPALLDLKGSAWTPSFQPDDRALVFLFVGVDCPISNRAQPELLALESELGPRGIRFVPVYAFADETPDQIRAHRADHGLAAVAYRDPEGTLARCLGAHRTPEVVAVDSQGRKIYQGRINDQYVALGIARPAPTRHDLADALRGYLAGRKPIRQPSPAVGCSFRSSSTP